MWIKNGICSSVVAKRAPGKTFTLVLFSFFIHSSSFAQSSVEPKVWSDEVAKKIHEDNSTTKNLAIITAEFQTRYRNRSLSYIKQLNNENLSEYFDDLNFVAFYAMSPPYARDLQVAFDELLSRKLVTKWHFQKMFGTLVAARDFDAARAFLNKFPTRNVEAIPPVRNLVTNWTGMAELVFSADGGELVARNFTYPAGPLVVMVAHPDCHFAANAFDSIEADKDLLDLLRGKLKVIAPQSREYSFKKLRNWNSSKQLFPISMVYSQETWHDVHLWDTPNFYFFLDGVLKAHLRGWPKEGRMDQFKAALKQISLKASDAS